MTFYEYLLSNFGYNTPIMMNEISYNNYSKPWINKELSYLCDSGKLIRYEKGIYYIPKMTVLGPTKLNPQKVINKKYINDGNEQNGYYSGISFLNQIGISTQVPNVIEIYTNNEKSKVREVRVGEVKVILRRARTKIDKCNVGVLSFLELMNTVTLSFLDDEKRNLIIEYIKENGITKKDITTYASYFPDKAMRTLIESEVIYEVK